MFFLLDRKVGAYRCGFAQTMGINLIAAAIFCVIFTSTPDWFFVRGLLVFEYSALMETVILLSIFVAAIGAPILIHKLSDRAKSRIKQLLAIIALLMLVEYILLVVITLVLTSLEFAYVSLGGEVPLGMYSSQNPRPDMVEFLSIAILLAAAPLVRFTAFNYHFVAVIVLFLDRWSNDPQTNFLRLLAANIAAYTMCVGFIYIMGDALAGVLSFQIQVPWAANFLYSVGFSVIAAPFFIHRFSRRIERLNRLLS